MNGNDILGITMAGLEAGFKVADIAAFPVETRGADAKASKILTEASLAEFDCIPVEDGDRIIGALERGSNRVFHLHGQPQASIAFLEIDDIRKFLSRPKSNHPFGWKYPPAGRRNP